MPSVFISGASSGIGASLAREYVRRGARVGCLARRAEPLEALAAELGADRCAVHVGDVCDAATMAGAARAHVAAFGLPDVVIANAGVSRGTLTGPVEDLDAFRRVLETNVLGIVHTFAPFVEAMRARGSGRLVGIASIAGFRGLPGSGAYCASKAAAITYLEALRVELHGSGVRVVTICPGYIATPMTQRNPYRMPFLMPVDRAARNIADAVQAARRFHVLPWQMAWVGRVLRILPRPLYDVVFARAPRKPRTAGTGDSASS